MQGIYEYSGIQRCGKNTKMTHDYMTKLMPEYRPDRVLSNYWIDLPGVRHFDTDRMVDECFRLWAARERHIVLMFDEVGQFMLARGYKDKRQTDFVKHAWQMPKRDWVMLYASNVGNSADIILRDATWVTICPHYVQGRTRYDDYITFAVLYQYQRKKITGLVLPHVWYWQQFFDSDQPID